MQKLCWTAVLAGYLAVAMCAQTVQKTAAISGAKASSRSAAAASQGGAAAVHADDQSAESAIRAVLDQQAAAWNRGDLRGFMSGYWNSPDLTFYSGNTVTSGWDATLSRYQARYQSSGAEMGKLDFSQLEIHAAGDGAWVGGRWRLKMSDGKEPGGMFTLIFRKMPEGWKIVHDHTS